MKPSTERGLRVFFEKNNVRCDYLPFCKKNSHFTKNKFCEIRFHILHSCADSMSNGVKISRKKDTIPKKGLFIPQLILYTIPQCFIIRFIKNVILKTDESVQKTFTPLCELILNSI